MEGGAYFFTVVSYHRQLILNTAEGRKLLRSALKNVRERYPFTIDAVSLLPYRLNRHQDFIVYNPVKYSLARSASAEMC